MAKKRVVGVGEILWDIYRDERFIGGAPANVALNALQLGHEGVIASRIGNDGLGQELTRSLAEKGLDPSWLQVDKKKGTGTVLIRLDVHGQPSFTCSNDVAFDYLEYSEALQELAATADVAAFGLLAQRQEASRAAILQFVESTKAFKIFDLNIRQSLRGQTETVVRSLKATNILKVNRDEIYLLMEAFKSETENVVSFVRKLIAEYKLDGVLLTLGDEGARMITANKTLAAEALIIQPVDLTGAGDAFIAGFIHKRLQKAPLQACLNFAVKTSAFVCTKRGATPEMSEAAIEAFAQKVRG